MDVPMLELCFRFLFTHTSHSPEFSAMSLPWDYGGPTIPDWLVRRTEISAGAKVVYAFLAVNTCQLDYPDYHIASGLKTTQVAKAVGASERSVRNWINELETVKLLSVEFLGWGRPNLYRFLVHPWQKTR